MAERFETCRACKVDVSVPVEVVQPRCPRCQGRLEPVTDGENADRTVVAWKPPPVEETATYGGIPKTDELPSAVPVPQPPVAPGTRFGPYLLESVLGKGGMGIVYRAHQPALQRWVALKVLTSSAIDEEDRKRFLNEARAAARLKHPNIVPVHDVGSVDGRDYFTMDLVEGPTLHEVARRRLLRPEDACAIVRKVALAVDLAHKEGIIHRDLKPGNILLDARANEAKVSEYEPRVTDFGLAKDLAQPLGLTLSGIALGSPPYMPPEQARGTMREVDHLSDVYSLGAVLYECFCGEPPFSGANLYEIVARIQTEEPVAPRKKNPSVSVDAETIVLRCLEKEKWRRYPSAGALARDLERLLNGEPIHAVRASLSTRINRRVERHIVQIISTLLMGVIVLGFATYLLASGAAAPETKTTVPEAPKDVAGPIEEAIRRIRRDENAYVSLRGFHDASTEPRWPDIRARAALLQGAARTSLLARIEKHAPSPGASDMAPTLEEMTDLMGDLEKDAALDASGIAAATSAVFAPVRAGSRVEGLAERAAELAVVRRALLAKTRAEVVAAAAPAFAGTATGALDVALAERLAAHLGRLDGSARDADLAALAGASRRLAAAVSAVGAPPLPPRSPGSKALERPDASGHRFRFPPVSIAPEPEPDLPQVRLLAPGVPRWLLEPTLPVPSLDGRRVIVGWLRFLHALDERGRVVKRQRLPGRAVSVQRAADGALLVACDPSNDGRSGPLLHVRSRELEGLELEDGRPVPAIALDVVSTFARPYELREIAHVTTEDTTNPWVRLSRARASREVEEALGDPALTDAERAVMACRAFALGFVAEAETAFHESLTDLVALHGYVPELAGYGEADVGLEIAEEAERAPRGSPAHAELVAWRDAFAPVLHDPRAKPGTFAPKRVAPPPLRPAPAKGVGGLGGRTFELMSIVLRFQRIFGWLAVAVGVGVAMRWRRQQHRDLKKVGAATFKARWLLYWKEPYLRLSFALPAYITTGDKLAILFLYVAYLGALPVQDAALKTLTATRRAPQALLSGLPGHPSARAAIEDAVTRLQMADATKLLAPEVDGRERARVRDRVVLGRSRWWSEVPRHMAELSYRVDMSATVTEFRAAFPAASADYERDLNLLERARNRFFWFLPSSVLLIVIWLIAKPKRMFEPGPDDIQPKLSTRVLRLLCPGAAQLFTGRPVRGVALAVPWLIAMQTVLSQLIANRRLLSSLIDPFFEGRVLPLAARLVAESPATLARIKYENGIILSFVAVAIYVVHWTDMYVSRRHALRLAARSTRGKLQIPLGP